MNKKIFIIVTAILVVGVGGFALTNLLRTSPFPSSELDPFVEQTSDENMSVKIVKGDIVLVRNGVEKQITLWGYNSDPVLSPDKKRIAFVSRSAQSVEQEGEPGASYKSSTNLWIITIAGTDPIQVTTHKNGVYRSKLHWRNNNSLLFVEGAESVRVYELNSQSTRTVLGPEEPVSACFDACGYSIQFQFSPKQTYLVRLASGFSGIYGLPNNTILNTKTLGTREIAGELGPVSLKGEYPSEHILKLSSVDDRGMSTNSKRIIDLTTGQVQTTIEEPAEVVN